MSGYISLRALAYHLVNSGQRDPISLVHLVALGGQSADLLHLLKASGEPLGDLPSPRLQCELSLYAQQRYPVVQKESGKHGLQHAIHGFQHSPSLWETPLWIPYHYVYPDLPLLVYYQHVSQHILRASPCSFEQLWHHHLHRTIRLIALQVLFDSGLWDEIYEGPDGIIAVDHHTQLFLLLSEQYLTINKPGYQQHWQRLGPLFIGEQIFN
ncbi:hypothetical protein L4D13_05415 [Photobacterium profundum]|uniref:hypothetical protein n=1 Tax=Photobacterium profundum TaxID=74109 RepID=UPI003D0B0C16